MKISSKKLAEIRSRYLNNTGSTDPEDIIADFELSGQEEFEAYLEGLRVKYPDDFPPLEDDEPEFTYFLKGEGNLLQELELTRNKKGVLVFAIKEPKDIVTVLVKGKTVDVDLIQLRKLPAGATEHGLPVARLIELAEIARG